MSRVALGAICFLLAVANSCFGQDLLTIRVQDEKERRIGGGRLAITISGQSGVEIWSGSVGARDGRLSVRRGDLPDLADATGMTVEVQVPGYVPARGTVSLPVGLSGDKTRLAPSEMSLTLRGASPWLTLLLILPAILGLPAAVARTVAKQAETRSNSFFRYGGAGLWAVVLFGLTVAFIREGQSAIPVYWPTLFVPSGLVIASILGVFCYAAFSVMEKSEEFFDDEPESKAEPDGHMSLSRRRQIRVMAGRVWITPYVAIAVWVVVASANPTFAQDYWSLLIGFFIGLYIKVALSFLQAVGTRLLSKEEAEKLADRGLAGETQAASAEQRLGIVAPPGPPKAFLDAVEKARRELMPLPNVVAVVGGTKLAGGEPVEGPAIVVYVLRKEAGMAGEQQVPKVFEGVATDVQLLPAPASDESCWPLGMAVDGAKLSMEAARQRAGVAGGSPVERVEGTSVLLLLDPLVADPTGNPMLDARDAMERCAAMIPAETNFVTFVVDETSIPNFRGNYAKNIRVKALGDTRPADDFGGPNLLAYQVLRSSAGLWHILHEVAHTWCAYVRIGAEGSTQLLEAFDRPNAEQALYHWRHWTVCDRSPGPLSQIAWEPIAGEAGLFEANNLLGDFRFSELELYLMGLKPDMQSKVKVLKEEGNRRRGRLAREVGFQEIPRRAALPAERPVRFRQVYVVVSRNRVTAKACADRFEGLRVRADAEFSKATGGLAELSSLLAENPT